MEWLSFAGGVIGALLGIIPVLIVIRYENKRWMKQNMIERLPYFFVDKFEAGKDDVDFYETFHHKPETYDDVIECELTGDLENDYKCSDIGVRIENISGNHAIGLRIVPETNCGGSMFPRHAKEVNKLSPGEIKRYVLRIKYNSAALLKRKKITTASLFDETFVLKICYNTPYDEHMNKFIRPSDTESYWRANVFRVYIILIYNYETYNNTGVMINDFFLSTTKTKVSSNKAAEIICKCKRCLYSLLRHSGSCFFIFASCILAMRT